MYQNIHYSFHDRTIHLRDDEEGWVSFPYKPTFYRISENGQYKTLDGRNANPTTQYIKGDLNLLETDIPAETRTLVDLYKDSDEPPKFHNIVFLDIETEIGGALTPQNIKNAKNKVTAIALYDVNTKMYTCYILDENESLNHAVDGNKEIIPCLSERELLTKFLTKWEELDPTIIVGYNSEFFDIPYLYFRLEKIVGLNQAVRLSPLRIISHTEKYGTYGGIDDDFISIAGINHLDYLLLFKKYTPKQEPSYKLGDIGLKYANLGKIEYKGNLDKLFKEDVNKFIEYNIRDVEILLALDAKLQFVDISILICHLCHVSYDKIYYATALNEGAILNYLKLNDIVSPNKPTTTNFALKQLEDDKNKYAGGFLKDPIPGLYEDIIDMDAVSLYPSEIKSLNIGVETLVGSIASSNRFFEQNCTLEKLKQRDSQEIITIQKLNKHNYKLEDHDIELGKLISYIEKNNFTISAAGSFFRTDKESIASKILKRWFNKREESKIARKKAGLEKDWDKYKFHDRRQSAYKILQVSLYGTYARSGWRYSDGHKIISSAITNTGQRVIQESISFINDTINNELQTDHDYIVASDTDSAFVKMQPLLLKRFPDLDMSNKVEKNKAMLEITNDLQNKANKNLDRVSKELFNIQKEHYFELKQELIVERAYWGGKRRYALYVTNREGVEKEELVIMGLELMKSNFPKLFRTFGEEIIKKIMFGAKKNEISKLILEFKKSIPGRTLKEIAKPTGVSKIRECIEYKPKPGELFSILKKGAAVNSKACVKYNDIINFKNLKYPEIKEHDKIYWVYLKQNPYKIDALAFFGDDDPPEIMKYIEEYVDKEKTFNTTYLNKLETLYKNIGWQLPSMNEFVSKFFVFD